MRTLALLASLLIATALSPARAAELPGDSVYRLPITLTDQVGRTTPFAARAGKPRIVSMFYTSCPFMCPLIIEAAKRTQKALAPDDIDVLLVSFDAANDTPAKLKQTFVERKAPPGSWTLARTDAPSVRQLAAVLDIQYRALPDGDFNHTSVLVLLDGQGRIAARSEKMDGIDADFVAAAKKLLDAQHAATTQQGAHLSH